VLADAGAISAAIAARLDAEADRLGAAFSSADAGAVRYCWIDSLLPDDVMLAAFSLLPTLDALAEPIRQLVMALNSRVVADVVARIIGAPFLETDPKLYNSGITAMVPGDFMCPHLDNSHDYDRARRRAVALIYYMAPSWRADYGGSLELWGDDRRAQPRSIDFCGNRLVIMETTDRSWHSVTPILGPLPRVNAISYFYAPSPDPHPLRLTRFAPWPGHRVQELLFSAEFHLRSLAARLAGRRLRFNRHLYTGAGTARRETQDLPAPEQF